MEFKAGSNWRSPEDPGEALQAAGRAGGPGRLVQPGAEGQQLCPQGGCGEACPGQAAKTVLPPGEWAEGK